MFQYLYQYLHLLVLILILFHPVVSLKCEQIAFYQVCEIPIDLPRLPDNRGIPIDLNFSSPSKKLERKPQSIQIQQNPIEVTSSVGTSTSNFNATINGDNSPEDIRAINFCMDRVSENWISTITVHVSVEFIDLGDQGILGSAQATRNWLVDEFICPVALAEAVVQKDLNVDISGNAQYDIVMRLNTRTNWYKGIDALPKPGTYDMVTVCLHEVYHGLFLSGSNLNVARRSSDGAYLARFINDQYVNRFDAFMGNQDGCSVKGYSDDTQVLGSALTGNNLYFVDDTKRLAQLHAPRPYVRGSSLYHLSELTYAVASGEDLMTPAIGTRYAQHNIGAVLEDMQKVIIDINSKRGAKLCSKAEIKDPVVNKEPIKQGLGSNDNQGNEEQQGSFQIQFGNVVLSGWIIVGVGVGVVVIIIIAVLFTCGCGKRKQGRSVGRVAQLVEDYERPAIGDNGGGLV